MRIYGGSISNGAGKLCSRRQFIKIEEKSLRRRLHAGGIKLLLKEWLSDSEALLFGGNRDTFLVQLLGSKFHEFLLVNSLHSD